MTVTKYGLMDALRCSAGEVATCEAALTLAKVRRDQAVMRHEKALMAVHHALTDGLLIQAVRKAARHVEEHDCPECDERHGQGCYLGEIITAFTEEFML